MKKANKGNEMYTVKRLKLRTTKKKSFSSCEILNAWLGKGGIYIKPVAIANEIHIPCE